MYIKSLSLKDFRNISEINIELSEKTNILYGDNGQGKTNILESIYISSMGRSQKTRTENHLIKKDKKEAHITTYTSEGNTIDVHIVNEGRKSILVNKIPVKKLGDLFGNLLTVIFSPDDLNLIKGGPSERRRFLDMEICQINPLYYNSLKNYYKILKQRNLLLKLNDVNYELLSVYDEQLFMYAEKIISLRESYIKKINDYANDKHKKITSGKEELLLKYKPNVNINDFFEKFKQNREKDIYLKNTMSGPHKDDISFFINGKDAKIYGSQGQQRTAVLSVKLSEIDIIKNITNKKPVLLLDDVLSELDDKRQSLLVENMFDLQTIITCTGFDASLSKLGESAKVFCIKEGNII